MWPKDDYQEQMLGYLAGMQTKIERFADSRHQRHDLSELYADLDIASQRLWRLIGATDLDWEDFRNSLEVGCDELLRVFYRAPPASALKRSVRLTVTEKRERHSNTAIRRIPETTT